MSDSNPTVVGAVPAAVKIKRELRDAAELRAFVAKCREPFPPEQVGQLPRVTCRDCSDRRTQCSKHRKQKCDVCKAWVSTAHMHIDFVGHPEVTARLLDIDPLWNWEPMAYDEDGLPKLVEQGHNTALWIRLTVNGITRPGVGTEATGHPELLKILVGDALRNAAMRFGIALDLWSKADEIGSFDDHSETGSKGPDKPRKAPKGDRPSQPREAAPAGDGGGSPDPDESPRDAMLRRFLHLPSKESLAVKRALEVLPRPSDEGEVCWPIQGLDEADDVARVLTELDDLGVPL